MDFVLRESTCIHTYGSIRCHKIEHTLNSLKNFGCKLGNDISAVEALSAVGSAGHPSVNFCCLRSDSVIF